jgi:hypothetical protein
MRKLPALILVTLLPLAACGKSEPPPASADGAHAATPASSALGRRIQQAMAEASAKLATENMQVGDHDGSLPKAEISPQGDLLIKGKPVAVDEAQRKLLLAHRANLVAVAQAGIAIGMQGADLGIEAATGALKSVFSGESEEFGKQMEARGQQMELEARKICDTLSPLLASQQALAAALPAFAPYATMDQSDIDDCGEDGHYEVNSGGGSDGDTDADAHTTAGNTMDAAAEADAAAARPAR